jgi:hypothetical protein
MAMLIVTLVANLSVASPAARENTFRSDLVLVDLFGLGSFNRGASGDLQNQLAQKSLPTWISRASTGIQEKSMQFSGRPSWGAGLGVTGLLTRHIGINVDQLMLGREPGDAEMQKADFGYLRYQTSAGLVLRLPLEKISLAPYGIVGGGAQYGTIPKKEISANKNSDSTMFTLTGQGFLQVGGGLEWRVLRGVGVFSDLRWMYSGVSGLPENQMQFRYGLRFAF